MCTDAELHETQRDEGARLEIAMEDIERHNVKLGVSYAIAVYFICLKMLFKTITL